MNRLLRRLSAIVLLALAGVALHATGASAHALVRTTTPLDGEELDTAPTVVTVEFNEPVSVGPGGIRVFDDEGNRVDTGDATADGDVVSVDLQPDLEDGTYVVSWRATSADGHPVHAAFVFSVGEPSTSPDDLLAEVVADTSDRDFETTATVLRFLQYAAGLLAAGALLFLVRISDMANDRRPAIVRVALWACVVVAVTALLGVFVQTALVTGLGWSAMVSSAVGGVLTSLFGLSALVLLVGAGVMALAARRLDQPPWQTAALVGAAVTVAAFAITGHTVTTKPVWLVVASDVAHAGAAAAWFGGLAALLLTLRGHREANDPVAASLVVSRFSSMATVAVAVVSAAGLALAWAEVRALQALFSTGYGLTLVAKVVVVGAVLLVGAYNRRSLVPAVRQAKAEAWGRLRRTVTIEIVGLTVAIALTAVLVNLVPAADAAGITGLLSVRTDIGPDHQVDVTIDPNRAGPNEMHFYLFDDSGRPVPADEFHVELEMPAQQIGPLEREPSVAGPGHWVLPVAEIPIGGRWLLRVTADLSRFDQITTEIPIDVGG